MGSYIDRDELLELYANIDGLDISNYDVKVAVIRQNILDMPTIDIMQCSEGEWLSVKLIDDDSDFNEVDGVQCSVCGDIYDEYWATTYFHYCPNCGAKMKGASDICGDNRFEIIERAKTDLLESTNIELSGDEMKVLDEILFRCWQMGWLDKYDVKSEVE